MAGKTITLTKELIEAGRTGNGGYRKKQIIALGAKYPTSKGWIDSLIGKDISKDDYQRFLNLSTKVQASKIVDGSTEQSYTKRARKLAQNELTERELDIALLSELSDKL